MGQRRPLRPAGRSRRVEQPRRIIRIDRHEGQRRPRGHRLEGRTRSPVRADDSCPPFNGGGGGLRPRHSPRSRRRTSGRRYRRPRLHEGASSRAQPRSRPRSTSTSIWTLGTVRKVENDPVPALQTQVRQSTRNGRRTLDELWVCRRADPVTPCRTPLWMVPAAQQKVGDVHQAASFTIGERKRPRGVAGHVLARQGCRLCGTDLAEGGTHLDEHPKVTTNVAMSHCCTSSPRTPLGTSPVVAAATGASPAAASKSTQRSEPRPDRAQGVARRRVGIQEVGSNSATPPARMGSTVLD